MRTTVTLDDDVVRELKARAKQTDKSFKQVLNDSLRLAFSSSRASIRKMKPFRVRPHSSALRPGIDFEKLNQLVDQLEVEERLVGAGVRPARQGARRVR
ncbi:antitoxin [bacterium]|nr:antitoxin [bacterium]